MHAYARLSPGPGFQLRPALLYYLQRLITQPAARRIASSLIAAAVRRRHGAPSTEPLDPAVTVALERLHADGVALLPALASDRSIGAMAAYFMGQPVIIGNGERTTADRIPADVAVASYDLQTVLACPGVIELVNSPAVIRIAESYLGCKPTLSSLGVRWSFPGTGEEPRFRSFHRDLDDWRFLKLFVYLTDVCEQSGPHSYARGSHNTGFGLRARAYETGELERRYGPQSVLTITGPRGTSFMADTIGIHCGERPTTRPRLMLQVQYSILPVYAFRYEPRAADGRNVDAYCNRLLLTPSAAQPTDA